MAVYGVTQSPQTGMGHNGLGQQLPSNNGEQQPQQQQYNSNGFSILLNSIALSSRAGNAAQPNESGAFTAFSTNKQARGPLSDLLESNQIITDDQYLSSIISNATILGATIVEHAFRRNANYFNLCRIVVESFKKPNPQAIKEEIFEKYALEIENNQNFFKYILSYTGLYFAGRLVGRIRSMPNGWEPNQEDANNIFQFAFHDVVCLCFSTWLETQPNVLALYNNCTPAARARIQNIDENIESCRAVFTELKSGQFSGVEIAFPWKGGLVQRIEEAFKVSGTYAYSDGWKNSVPSTNLGLEQTSYELYDSSLAPKGSGNKRDITQINDREYLEWLNSVTGKSIVKEKTEYTPNVVDPIVEKTIPFYDELHGVNKDNWKYYDLGKYFKPVPGLPQSKRICEPMVLSYFSKAWKGPIFPKQLAELLHTVILVTLDYEDSSYQYEVVYLGTEEVDKILTNPEEVLPYVKVNNDGTLQHSFDKSLVSTNELKTQEGIPCKISEVVGLKVPPKVIYGNKPLVADSVDKIFKSLDYIDEKHDPDNQMDAIVLPCKVNFDFKLSNHIEATVVDRELSMLLIDNPKPEGTLIEFIESVKKGLIRVNDDNLTKTIRHAFTNTVNRWLVERYMYPESSAEKGHLSTSDIFEDIHDILISLKNRGENVIAANLLKFAEDSFLLDGFRILLPAKERIINFNKRLKIYDDEYELKMMEDIYKQTIILTRNVSVAKLNKMGKINGTGQALFPKSMVPSLHYLFRACERKFEKHFNGDHVPMLICFNGDKHKSLFYCTDSAMDSNIISARYLSNTYPLALTTPMKPYG